jgi:hypothetical protein
MRNIAIELDAAFGIEPLSGHGHTGRPHGPPALCGDYRGVRRQRTLQRLGVCEWRGSLRGNLPRNQ